MEGMYDLAYVAEVMRHGIEVKDRSYHLKTYENCFLGTDATQWIFLHTSADDETEAIALGNALIRGGYIYHVAREKPFANKAYFYRFTADDDRGKATTDAEGNSLSWAQQASASLPSLGDDNEAKNTDYEAAVRLGGCDERLLSLPNDLDISPLDEHNIRLLDHVHPPKWQNPTNKSDYTMIVIGAGAGGLVTAAGAAGVGTRVAIIEEHMMGGDCLNFGCVPSKALIRAARAAKDAQTCGDFGVEFSAPPTINFGKAMERLRKIRTEISHHDSCERYSRELDVDVYQDRATFVDKKRLTVGGKVLTFQKAIIATGAKAAVPSIPGLKDVPFLTNYTIFNLTELPPRLAVIGAGPIGCELAQAMARFGSEVTCFVRSDKLLPKEDRDAAEIVHRAMLDDEVTFHFDTEYVSVHRKGAEGNKYNAPFNEIEIAVRVDGKPMTVCCDALLIATGRQPNVENMGLEAAGVKFDKRKGVLVNDYLQTSNKSIYAVGDVCTRFQFTHMADFMARLVIRNALFFGKGKVSSLLVPWGTYTEPEVAHVGWYESDLERRKIAFDTYKKDFKDVDRAICDGELEGFVKIHCKKGTDEILGATIVNAVAGNMISELTLAMQHKVGLGALANVIHPYPTQAEAIRQCGDLYNRTRLTSTVKGLLGRLANRSLTK